MYKKNYSKPIITVYNVKCESLLAGSTEEDTGSVIGSAYADSELETLSRDDDSNSVWDD